MVVLKLIFLSVVAVTRLKADNPLYGSSLIDYVRHLLLLIMLCVRACVCYISHCYACLNFQAHIEQWIDFASLEIDAHLLSWYRPRMGRAVYLPPVSYILYFIEGIVLFPFGI